MLNVKKECQIRIKSDVRRMLGLKKKYPRETYSEVIQRLVKKPELSEKQLWAKEMGVRLKSKGSII